MALVLFSSATRDVLRKWGESLAQVKSLRPGKDKGRLEVGLLFDDGSVKKCSVSPVCYAHLGEPKPRESIGERETEILISEDEQYRAMKKALSLLAYSDKSKSMLYSRLVGCGYTKASAAEAVKECTRLGYIDEREQICRFIKREANQSLKGRLHILRKASSKGFKVDDVKEIIGELEESGEISFEHNFERLCEKHGAVNEEEKAALKYKNGYTGWH